MTEIHPHPRHATLPLGSLLLGALLLGSLLLWGLAPAAAAQDQAGPPPPPAALPEGWVPLDGVAIVVNSDTITRRAIERYILRRLTETEVTTQADRIALLREAQRAQVENLLVRQAGENLGFPEELVDAHVSNLLEERTKEAGGTFEMAQKLRQEETTATEIREELEEETLVMEWRRKIAGHGAPGARTTEDRYARPGRLAQHYRRIQRTGRDIQALEFLGAKPATYELQILLLHPQVYGSLEESRAAALGAREALEAGTVDWDELIDDVGSYENRGLTGPRRIEDIQFALDPGDNRLVQYVMEGRLDHLSEVLPFPIINPTTGERRVGGFAIYRLLRREPAEVPDYEVQGVQKQLRRVLGSLGDELRIQLALEDLERTAYIWYPGIEAQEAELEARRERRRQQIEEARRRNAAQPPTGSVQPAESAPPEEQAAPTEKPAQEPPVDAPEGP